MADEKIKVDDRVKRANGQGCYGTVKALRTEVTSKSEERKEKSLMINVLWDNGTQSYFSSEALQIVKE